MAPLLPGIAKTRAKGHKALGLRLGLRLGLKVRLGWGWGCGQGEMGRGQVTIAGGGGAVAQHAYCDYTYCGYTCSHRVVRQRQRCTAAHLRTTTSQSISATDLSGATTGDTPVHHARRHQP